MKALFLFVSAIALFACVAVSAEACDRCVVSSTSVVVCDRVVGQFQVVERTVVQKGYFVRPVEPVCGRVVGVGRAAVGTAYDTSVTAVRVVASVPIEIGGLAHRAVHRFDDALFEGRRSYRYRD